MRQRGSWKRYFRKGGGMKAFIKKFMISVYAVMNRLLPKSSAIAVFSSSNGKSAGGNPRAILRYAVRHPHGVRKFIWILTDEYLRLHPEAAGTWNPSVKIVRYGHPAYYYYMSRAGIWVFDSRQEPYIRKGKGVRYLQTWHGTPLKKLGLDLEEMKMAGEGRDIEGYRRAVADEASMWDLLIAQNDFSADIFRRCFDYKGEILKIGYPRNDVLVRSAGKIGEEKTILYAPTWREYSSPLDLEKLEELLGDDYRIIIKPHYLVKLRKGDIPEKVIKSGFAEICPGEGDIFDLYLKADVLITDYSSAMFDYSLLGRPMIFYAYDLREYSQVLRGFYFDFEKEAPGPLCMTTEEVAEAVRAAFDANEPEESDKNTSGSERTDRTDGTDRGKRERNDIKHRTEEFRKRYNMYDDGHAAEKAWKAVTGG